MTWMIYDSQHRIKFRFEFEEDTVSFSIREANDIQFLSLCRYLSRLNAAHIVFCIKLPLAPFTNMV